MIIISKKSFTFSDNEIIMMYYIRFIINFPEKLFLKNAIGTNVTNNEL